MYFAYVFNSSILYYCAAVYINWFIDTYAMPVSLLNKPKRRRNYIREKDIFHSHYERFISGAIQL